MKGVNKAIIVGTVGSVNTNTSSNGTIITNVSVATSNSYVKDGQTVAETDWHSCVFFGKLAEIAQKFIVKGKKVYIEGALKTSKYMKEGAEHQSTKIIVREMQILSPKDEAQSSQPQANAEQKRYHDAGYRAKDDAPWDDSIPF